MEAEHVVDDIEGPATTSAGITDSNPAVANTDSEIVVSDFKPTTGFADDQACVRKL